MALTKATGKMTTFLNGATGSVKRDMHDKLADVVSVKDFGAVGDGVTDDTAAIQAAIDYAASLGKTLILNSGTYSITSLTIPQQEGGIHIVGETRSGSSALATGPSLYKGAVLVSSQSTGDIISCDGGVSYINRAMIFENFSILVNTSGYAISFIGAPEVLEVKNLTVRNNNSSGSGVKLSSCWSGALLEGLLIHTPTSTPNTGYGIYLNSALVAGGVKIDRCQVTGFGRNIFSDNNIYQILVQNCAFESGGYGAYVDSESTIEFNTCHFEYNKENAIYLTNSEAVTIRGCSFYSNATSPSAGTLSEIDVDGNPTYNLSTTITDNHCFGLEDNTTFIRISEPAFSSGVISNNFIKAIGTSTTGIFASATPSTWAISNNFFDSVNTNQNPNLGWRVREEYDSSFLYFKGAPYFDGDITLKSVQTLSSDGTSTYLKSNAATYFQISGVTRAALNSSGDLDITGGMQIGSGNVIWQSGSGSPEGVVTAPVGSIFSRTDGGAGTSFYVKESGTGNTGWVAK